MTTRRAPSNSIAISSADVALIFPAYTSSADWLDVVTVPPPVSTLPSERFIALHMICVRMKPDAPTSEPVMMSALLSSTKPVAAAARPEYEFSSAMATGMSAPPIGTVSRTPPMSASPTRRP
jgi:hypothetical protein